MDSQNRSQIDLSNQNLEILPNLSSCRNVISLKLDDNSLSTIGCLPENLENLSIRNNQVAFFGQLECERLKTCDYTNNRLISLDGIEHQQDLIELYLGQNYVGDDQMKNLQKLGNLKVLDISDNNLRDGQVIEPLQSLNSLEVLHCSGNKFSALTFEFFPKLQCLVLDSNRLSFLKFMWFMPSLTYLSLKDNEIGDVDFLSNTSLLKELWIDGNSIQHLSIPQMNNLAILSACNNSIVDADMIRCPNLTHLNLDDNRLETLDFLQTSSKLQVLSAAKNRLLSIYELGNCTELKQINLGSNMLNSLDRILSVLQNLSNVEDIDLKWNPCTNAYYPCIEQLPTNQSTVAFTTKDYDALYPSLDDAIKNERTKYRARIISLFCSSIKTIDSLKVSTEEIENDILLDKGNLLSPMGFSCTSRDFTQSPIMNTSRQQVSFSAQKFSRGLFPQFSSLTGDQNQSRSLSSTPLKTSISPDQKAFQQTSVIESPSYSHWESKEPKHQHRRSSSIPLIHNLIQRGSSVSQISEVSGFFEHENQEPILQQDMYSAELENRPPLAVHRSNENPVYPREDKHEPKSRTRSRLSQREIELTQALDAINQKVDMLTNTMKSPRQVLSTDQGNQTTDPAEIDVDLLKWEIIQLYSVYNRRTNGKTDLLKDLEKISGVDKLGLDVATQSTPSLPVIGNLTPSLQYEDTFDKNWQTSEDLLSYRLTEDVKPPEDMMSWDFPTLDKCSSDSIILRTIPELPPLPVSRLDTRSPVSQTSLAADLENPHKLNPYKDLRPHSDFSNSKVSEVKAYTQDQITSDIIAYSQIPPRPILNQEAKSAIITQMNPRASEFERIQEFWAKAGCKRISKIFKRYEFFQTNSFSNFLQQNEKVNPRNRRLAVPKEIPVIPMFHLAHSSTIGQIMDNGFENVYRLKTDYVFAPETGDTSHGRLFR